MKVIIEPEKDSRNFDDPENAKSFIEKKFREFQTGGQERLKIELRK